jgi:hypothetical protein
MRRGDEGALCRSGSWHNKLGQPLLIRVLPRHEHRGRHHQGAHHLRDEHRVTSHVSNQQCYGNHMFMEP